MNTAKIIRINHQTYIQVNLKKTIMKINKKAIKTFS